MYPHRLNAPSLEQLHTVVAQHLGREIVEHKEPEQ